ncbi:hypothetical protein [Xenorhabdus bovienii]|uniref:Uncharacterized protein n=1 Tax=Xenorhabdus bovienii TaxID=40576 RepID=A0AAJ1JE95_XENBV|nr:hypothetical protein [Xenorhabdus bovienii]MDE1480682.1 hypothetical protein [Xenorhabdus bovienii]MDE9512411.1 hypothetical protein [Xenorhabdus bovienii]MDE9524041.1 hypothetical protein [Xenorhabdus bovienii]MDE9589965.1 hypothetical protein [Xenorhabdus bovienii]
MTTFVFAAIKRSDINQKHPVRIKCVAENYQQAKMMVSVVYITAWAGQVIAKL